MKRAEEQPERITQQEPSESLSLVTKDLPLVEVLEILGRQTGLSFVAEASLDDRLVTIEARDVTLNEFMDMLSRRLGAEVHRAGSIYYVGAFRPEDRAIFVRRVRRLDASDINNAISTVLSSDGRVQVYDDGLVVIADKRPIISRVGTLIEQIEANEGAVWAVQFWLVSLTDSAAANIGFDITPTLDVAVAFAEGSAAGAVSQAALTGGLDAVLEATQEESDAELVIEHLAVITDGIEHSFSEGTSFPIRVSRVSNEGTATTTGVEFVNAGIQFRGRLREYSPDKARLVVEVELSEVLGIVDGFAPQLATTTMNSDVLVMRDGVYLLRSHRTGERRAIRSALLRPGVNDDERARTFQLWARVRRVGGPARTAESDVRSERGPRRLPPPSA